MRTILLTQDYFFWSKVDGTAKAVGVPAQLAKSLADVQASLATSPIRQLFVDLRHPEAFTVIALCVEKNIPTVGFVSHADTATIAAARAAGCTTVMAKSQFSARLGEILKSAC